jgi:hypothetical protein
MNTTPIDSLISLDEMRDLVEGSPYRIKVRDIDRAAPGSRGASFDVVFNALDVSDDFKTRLGEFDPEDPRYWMLYCFSVDDPKLLYGFHAWLVESIEEIS